MGLSASQARFLELTARKSNAEYQVQRINFERLQLSDQAASISHEYNEKMSNRKMTFSYNNGEGLATVDLCYTNYKNYMNQQLEGINTPLDKMFLVSSSGNKIIVSNEEDIAQMMSTNLDDEGNSKFQRSDFMIVDKLDDVENFQRCIQEGIYYFATYEKEEGEDEARFKTMPWETLGGGAIRDEYDKSDDAKAQAEYDEAQSKIQSMDKKLELQLNRLETERDAIKTEMEGVEKVIEDNIESSYKVFG